MAAPRKYPEELRERATWMSVDLRQAGRRTEERCDPARGRATRHAPKTPRSWVRQAEIDGVGVRANQDGGGTADRGARAGEPRVAAGQRRHGPPRWVGRVSGLRLRLGPGSGVERRGRSQVRQSRRPGETEAHRDRPEPAVAGRPGLVRTHAGWTYVAFVLDVFSRMIVGRQVSTSLSTHPALGALDVGLWARRRACARRAAGST